MSSFNQSLASRHPAGPRAADSSGLMLGLANALPLAFALWCVLAVLTRVLFAA